MIFKESAVIIKDDINKIISGDYAFLLDYKNNTTAKIYSRFTKDFFKPVIIIDYRRDAYYLELNNIRITFDSNICKEEINLNDLFGISSNMSSIINNNKIIMELKFKGFLPSWVKNLLQLPRFESCAISKYTLSRYIEN